MYMKLNLTVPVLLAVTLLAGCAMAEGPLPNGKTWIKGNGQIFVVNYVQEHSKELIYAFVVDPSVPFIGTNDPGQKPGKFTVHWLCDTRDGLWIFGQKIQIPAESKLFAIRKDGTIHPISCTPEQIQAIGMGGFSDDEFVRDALLPALGKAQPASAAPSKGP
jgi:hypothetical protein